MISNKVNSCIGFFHIDKATKAVPAISIIDSLLIVLFPNVMNQVRAIASNLNSIVGQNEFLRSWMCFTGDNL